MAEKAILTMKGITKTFPGVKALSNVDFKLCEGDIHALMGENGAGKSTLIKVLTGIYPFDAGEIIMDGKPLWRFGIVCRNYLWGRYCNYQRYRI